MADMLLLENAFLRACVTAQGGAVLSLDSLECHQPVLREGQGRTPGDGGLFPMVPLANRVESNRFTLCGREIALPQPRLDEPFFLHGDGWLARWQITAQSRERCTLSLRQRHACGFDYLAELTYRLNHRALETELSLTHLGETPMIYGGGVHPFFHVTPQSRIQFSASGYWPEGDSHLPLAWTDALPAGADFSEPQYGCDQWLNVCYSGWNGRATILHERMSVTLTAPTSWLMLFRLPGEPFVCLEPQSHPVNAHRMPGQPGLVMLRQGEIWRFSTSILVNSHDKC